MKKALLLLLSLIFAINISLAKVTTNPDAVVALLQRVANINSNHLTTILDTEAGDKETFTISSANNKPVVKASTLSALTAGINWYLNHYAHVNISWSNLTTDLSTTTLPLPTSTESHTANVDHRYYLNYCTFSYSMSTWTWDRWEKEIDWMALHGINMPLQIIGLDVVWRDMLTKYYGYTTDEANEFIAGPCFQAWFGMNNLEGWGGPNPQWWYDRQETLAKNILKRERELGIEPVLPGFSGMVPHNFTEKTGVKTESQGDWQGFLRPYIIDPTSSDFNVVARNYYECLHNLMGRSRFYSMDPFHEGGRISSGKYAEGYTAIYNAMNSYCGTNSLWVIQQWYWASHQATSLSAVPAGRLLVLDLYSDGDPYFDKYNGYAPQTALYCTITNFGGRSGFMGRLDKQMREFFAYKQKYPTINGIGATPEAIEQVPVLYDNLYELPWMSQAPADAKEWLRDYTTARYGQENADAQSAWEELRTSALNCTSTLQGPQEAVYCSRPSLTVNSVSTWGGTDIFYNPQDVVSAAYSLLKANISSPNYDYDLIEVTRQALSDYAKSLLAGIKEASADTTSTDFKSRRDKFLNLILDIDRLLGTNENFRLGHWTQMARDIANEAQGTTTADCDWLDLNNARTLISTWGDYSGSEYGGLRDYSYRAWQGMLSDFYYPRWQYWFAHNMQAPAGGWFFHDWEWAHNLVIDYTKAEKTVQSQPRFYSPQPQGNTVELAQAIMPTYILPLTSANNQTTYYYRSLHHSLPANMSITAYRGETFLMPVGIQNAEGFELQGDFNNDGNFNGDNEAAQGLSISIPDYAPDSLKMRLLHSDGTQIDFNINVYDKITSPRTISVYSADPKEGTVSITGTSSTSITNMDPITVVAEPTTGYRFVRWTDEFQSLISPQNPFIYSSARDINLWAYFEWHPWQTPEQDLKDMNTIKDYAQYVNKIKVKMENDEATEIYSTTTCPSELCIQTQPIVCSPGQRITISWNGNEGLSYCYLTAYLDSNADGTFDRTIGKRGNNSSQSSAVPNGNLSFNAPYVECNTMVRFRFDSAWRLPEGPNYSTTRFVYDIPLIIETTTAIKNQASTSTNTQSTRIYNLQGQLVADPTKPGLYIKNHQVYRVSKNQ